MFEPVAANASFPRLEEAVLKFWRERRIYEQSLARREGAPRFVFYEGPPTANGKPHPGHCLTRAIKDLFPRYRTMRGYLCERKAGWDTHGLPVEVEVCKDLGIHSKEEIEAYGVEPFIHRCQESVWRYMKEWERLTERIGFWVDLQDAYVTYHQSYVESVWWSLKNLFERGLLYQGYKIVWWWAQGGTALSAGEVGQGYREVADPSVYVKLPLVVDPLRPDPKLKELGLGADVNLLVWTTTPWTLPANQFAAISPTTTYCLVQDENGTKLIFASALLDTIKQKAKTTLQLISQFQGRELIGLRYRPPFDGYYETMAFLSGSMRATPEGLSTRQMYLRNDCRLSEEDAAEELKKTDEHLYWRVVPGSFVTTDSGTGVVHVAPAFGEVDYEVLMRQRQLFAEDESFELFCPVNPDGTFTADATKLCHGRWVKDCDKDIARDLKQRGLLYHQEQYLHDYPFCWRADEDPLIQYPRRSWFIRTTQFKDAMLANNEQINWLPEHIKHGRFGNFLESNVDWALSRERYWGTPLPIWVCEKTGQMEAVGSYDELLAKPGIRGTEVWEAAKKANPDLVDDLKVHKPYIDEVTYDSPFAEGARMRRVGEVIDCWYDSGAMPFAQWGYRGKGGPSAATENFHEQFPADFISEAIDQTRGWFYSQLAISTMMFGEQVQGSKLKVQSGGKDVPASTLNLKPETLNVPYPHPFRNCVVLGLMLGEDGQKMSKSKRNYREPAEIFDRYGADALRWYFFANQPPWTSIRYAERSIKDSIPEFLLRLWNCYTFFVIYANIDGFDPAAMLGGSTKAGEQPLQLNRGDFAGAKGYRPVAERSELDRWVLSELNRTLAAVVERMDAYDNYEACKRINDFVDGLSNWYVRRSRDRFWAADKQSPDKLDAYWTLYECLVTTAKMIAPFTPFLAETLWQNLAGVFNKTATNATASGRRKSPDNLASKGGIQPSVVLESVHLCDYPTGDASAVDEQLSARMKLLREIASLGLSARMANKLKVRQPLANVEVILTDAKDQKWLEEHDELLRDELNVKSVAYTKEAEKYISYQVQPNFKRLGPRIGKLLPAVKQTLAQADGGSLLAQLSTAGTVKLDVAGEQVILDNEDIQVRLQAKPGWAAAQGTACVVVLATELTPELIAEGLARDVVRLIQDQRKELNLDFTDRIEVGIAGASDALRQAIEQNADYIRGETLAVKIGFESLTGARVAEAEVADVRITLAVRKA